jgi:16S rRNA (cytosine967-C5)-methyltransferase
MAALRDEGVEAEPTRWSPIGITVRGRLQSRHSPSFAAGLWEVQDEGSQLLALLCDARPGQTIVDACAGAGGKTLALAAMMQGRGTLFAFDNNPRRLAGLRPRARRADVHNVRIEVIDRPGHPRMKRLRGRADVVLIDAPCSGLGVLRRNPDAANRVTDAWLDELSSLQKGLLDQYARVVRPGGRMVYATCSVLQRENGDAVDAFVASHDEWRTVPAIEALAEAGVAAPDDIGERLELWPDRHGTDGFFAAVLERSSPAQLDTSPDPGP